MNDMSLFMNLFALCVHLLISLFFRCYIGEFFKEMVSMSTYYLKIVINLYHNCFLFLECKTIGDNVQHDMVRTTQRCNEEFLYLSTSDIKTINFSRIRPVCSTLQNFCRGMPNILFVL